MKRDTNFLKEALIKIEESEIEIDIANEMEKLGYEKNYVWHQLTIMENAELFLRTNTTFEAFYVYSLSNKGYDLLDQLRNKKTWKRLQKNIDKGNLNKIAEVLGTFSGSFLAAYLSNKN